MQQQEQDPTNLYISNLPVSMDEQELESMLKPFGQVISTRILRDANGTSRGVGFARWEPRPADTAWSRPLSECIADLKVKCVISDIFWICHKILTLTGYFSIAAVFSLLVALPSLQVNYGLQTQQTWIATSFFLHRHI